MSESTDDLSYPQTRAQPDITSGPEVRKFSNVRIPDFRFFSFPDSGHLALLNFKKSPRFLISKWLLSCWKKRKLSHDIVTPTLLKK